MAVLDYALTSLNKVKQYLFNSTSGNTYDTLLESLIDEVTDYIESEAGGRRFKDLGANISNEIHSGSDGKIIFPKQWPIESVESIELNNGTQASPDWIEVSEDDFTIDYVAGMITIDSGVNNGIGNYRITYQGGFTTIPRDLELCAIKMVAKEFEKRRSQGATNESIGGGSTTWNENIDPSNERVFKKYRRF